MIRTTVTCKPMSCTPLFLALLTLLSAAPLHAEEAASLSELKRTLARLASEKQLTQSIPVLDALFALGTPAALEAVAETALTKDFYELEKEVKGRIGELPAGPMLDKACELAADHNDYRVRVIFTLGLGDRKDQQSVQAIAQSLMDGTRAVVNAALEVIHEKDSLGYVDVLIHALLRNEERGPDGGGLCGEIRRHLTDLTGRDFTTGADWKNFWDVNKATFKQPPRSAKDAAKKEAEKSNVGKTAVITPKRPFFGIELEDNKVLFILDTSQSMLEKDPLPEEGGEDDEFGPTKKGPTTAVTPDKKKDEKKKEKPPQDSIPESRMRLRRVQKELIEVLGSLEETVDFNIITFNSTLGSFKGNGLVKATAKNKQEAIAYVQAFKPEGETYTDRAMEMAFEVPNVTTMYLLSDGAPRRENQLLPPEPIINFVKAQNRFRRVRINCVGFEQAGQNCRDFLRMMARAGRGTYKELK